MLLTERSLYFNMYQQIIFQNIFIIFFNIFIEARLKIL